MSENERNRELDAAWRAASTEEPPPALDTAIRAEARRAVGAGPRDARRRRYRQLRYPFAAAATVALLAFGIAQMTPPDQVAPSIVSDQPAENVARERAPPPQAPAGPPTQLAENAARRADQALPGSASVPSAAPQARPAPATVAPPPESGATMQRQSAEAIDAQARKDVRRREAPTGERFAEAPSPEEARSQAQVPSQTDSASAKLAQSPSAPEASTPPAGSAAGNAPKSEPFPATSAARDAYAEAPKREQAGPATAVGAVKRRSAAAAPMQATASDLDEHKAKQAGVESVEAWIARIRELKASGQIDAASKELARFRTTYGERADALLPQELRAGAPPKP